MPDKHEVGGSSPLEPTSRQCLHPIKKGESSACKNSGNAMKKDVH